MEITDSTDAQRLTTRFRCKKPDCPNVHRCPAQGKLLVTLKNYPEDLKGKGVSLEIPCPYSKKRIVTFTI